MLYQLSYSPKSRSQTIEPQAYIPSSKLHFLTTIYDIFIYANNHQHRVKYRNLLGPHELQTKTGLNAHQQKNKIIANQYNVMAKDTPTFL